MNSIGPPNIYDIHTYNTQNYYYQQNTWSKPPLLPRLTLTEAEVFLCEENKNKRKKENKPEAIFYNL